jgi:hypothetical protein
MTTRAAQRRKLLKAGSISFGANSVTCTIRDLSTTGAALQVKSSIDIPDVFLLAIEMEHRKHQCQVIWRKENRMGIAFKAD